MNAPAPVPAAPIEDPARVVELLTRALHAVEADDAARYRECIDALAEWRTRPLYATFGRLAREIAEAMSSLPVDSRLGALAGCELPDARARLDFVTHMTEEATHRTLDLVEENRRLLDEIDAATDPAAVHAAVLALRANLSQMALAQEYQDLTGQIIRRVTEIVGRVETALADCGVTFEPAARSPVRSFGPAIKHLDAPAVSQNDADALLSDLGF
jgi:chemotaxis protein CheZ